MPRKSKELPALFGEGELAAAPDNIAQSAFDAWNENAKAFGWPVALFLTSGRPAKLKRAVKDVGGLHAWRSLLEECGKSDFLCGRTQSRDRKPFMLKLDWLLAPANLLKVMERNYFEKPASVPMSIARQSDPETEWGRRTRGYLPGGLWMTHWGPKPEQPGCQAPPAWLVPWREKHGIVVVIHQKESRADRLAHSIATHRKLGNHARANALEAELAAIEGKPATLVPHPAAADHGMPQRAEKPPQRTSNMGHNRPPGPITDVDEDPGWDMVPEGDEALAES